jgi:protein-S-isoprenylcysteine O-methyltransferase Ste14
MTITAEAADPTPPERGADVRVVPPVVFAAAFAIGALADRWHHVGVPGGRRARPVGVGLMAAGAGLAASGAATFRRHRTTVIPHRPVSTFVTAGPYRFTRNPMYTGCRSVTPAALWCSARPGRWPRCWQRWSGCGAR